MRPVDQTDVKRAGELILSYLAEDEPGYEALVAYTMSEFDPETIISALIALLIGTCNGLDQTKILRGSLHELLAEATEEPWLTR